MKKQRLVWAIAGIVLLALTGLVHGLWTDRWQTLPELDAAAAALAAVPRQIGAWQGSDLELDPAELTQAGYAGSLWRRYDHVRDRTTVSVLLICGRPGPVCVHTPDVCYRGNGYEMLGEPARVSIAPEKHPEKHPENVTAEFWKGRFSKPSRSNPRQLCIYWAWNVGQGWRAPASPRLTFARVPVLFKLYLVCEMNPATAATQRDPCAALLPLLLPELEKTLGPACAGE